MRTSRRAWQTKQERQAARSSTEDEYWREASRLGKHDRDDPETGSRMKEAEVQNHAMHDPNSE